MKKNGVKTFIKDNKLALSLLVVSVSVTAVSLIILYSKYKKMKNAIKPVNGRITSKFGTRTAPVAGASTNHNGVDIAAPTGTPVVAPLDGKVSQVLENSKGGKQLIITHDNGYKTGYAHLSGYAVILNEKVKQGQTIAYVGSTGTSTGSHLHFTVTNPLGLKVNPEDYIKF
jgi:murein DD-endopeptidase MepM/ murein hydrolase activator NlpD